MIKYIDRYYLNWEEYGIKFWSSGRLPSEYQEVEYIESNGSWDNWQYIIPWISIESWISMWIEADFEWTNTTWRGEADLYSMYKASGKYIQNWFWESSLRFNCNFWWCTNDTYTRDPSTVAKNTRYSYNAEWTPSWDDTTWCYLLAQQESGSQHRCMSAKLYSVKLYKNNQLVRDFVPCYRKADTEIGLYDLVEWVFYTNDWSWSFTKGANV